MYKRQLRAYVKAWNAKVVPIFLTVVSTILGFIPFMIGEDKDCLLYTSFTLPVSLLPDIAIPEITVQVSAQNTSARELERCV